MKASAFLVLFSVLSGSAVSAVAVPEDSHAHVRYSKTPSVFDRDLDTTKDLWKRKGGGGRSGGGGGSSGGGSSSGGSRTLSSSNVGGRTSQGSGPPPPYSAGTYSGGAKVPQQAGKSFPATRVVPFVLVGGALAFWPGHWYYGAYMYPYHSHWHYRNHSRTAANKNETESMPVVCGCAQYASCACEENNNQTFIDSTIGNGSLADMKERNVTIGEYNGTKTILINGTLPNGTTAAGGEDDESGAVRMLHTVGYWPVVVTVMAAVFAV